MHEKDLSFSLTILSDPTASFNQNTIASDRQKWSQKEENMKANYNTCYTDTVVGRIQQGVEAIVDSILAAVQDDGRELEAAIRAADCDALSDFSEETPMALPLCDEDGRIIGVDIQCNERIEDEDLGDCWETFSLITVEVPAFAEIYK